MIMRKSSSHQPEGLGEHLVFHPKHIKMDKSGQSPNNLPKVPKPTENLSSLFKRVCVRKPTDLVELHLFFPLLKIACWQLSNVTGVKIVKRHLTKYYDILCKNIDYVLEIQFLVCAIFHLLHQRNMKFVGIIGIQDCRDRHDLHKCL